MKVLVISVGTGTQAARSAVSGLAEALAFSIRHHNPDVTVFVASRESEKTTLPLIIEKANLQKYDVITLEDPDNIQSIYEVLQPKISQLRKEAETLVVDYTSGTKAMTAALAILASIYEANILSYITGKRKDGIVQPKTEQIQAIRPYFISAEHKIKTAIRFFNQAQYRTASEILRETMKIKDPKIMERAKLTLSLAEAYDLWDKFQHEKAFKKLKKIRMRELSQNKQFLGELISRLQQNHEPEPYLIADLINNARRRAQKESKYDDAVARLYRTIEFIAQYRLKNKYNIDPSACPRTVIPETLIEKWKIPAEIETLKLALQKDYELLAAKGDILGTKYLQDKTIQDLLSKRNISILAHGQTSIDKKTWQKLYRKTKEYAEAVIENLNTLMKMSEHITLKE